MKKAPLLALLALCAVAGAAHGQAPSFPTSLGAFRLETDRLGPGTVTLVPEAGGPAATYPTIQAAVDAAQEGDTVLLSDGLFYGPGNRDVFVEGKNLTIRSENGPERCVIDCMRRGRAFLFQGPLVTSETLLTGVTIVRGDSSERATPTGGGILVRAGSLATIDGCVVLASHALAGGAIAYANSTPAVAFGVIRNCLIAHNRTNVDGGGIISSNALIERCSVLQNRAFARGGAISASGTGLMRDCLIAGNSVESGGSRGAGIVLFGSNYAIENCTIVNNTGATSAGGVALQAGVTSSISNSIIWGNSASLGSQIYLDQISSLTLDHCTIDGGMAGIGAGLGATASIVAMDQGDPLFVDAPGGDFHLSPGSPSIDTGNPLFLPVLNHADLDGFPRVANGVVDRGCYEYWPGLALSLLAPGRSGEVNTIRARGAQPGTPTAFFYGEAAARLDLSFAACPSLELAIASPVLLDAPSADALGESSYSSFVPPALSGIELVFQAIAFDPLAPRQGCGVSNLVHFTYP